MAEARWGRPSKEATGEGAAEDRAVISDPSTTTDSSSLEDVGPVEAEDRMEAAGPGEAADPSAAPGPTGAAAADRGEYTVDDGSEETGTVLIPVPLGL